MNCANRGCQEPTGAQCHCAACHQTFGTLGLFEAHQGDGRAGPPWVPCSTPEALGLLLDGKGIWQTEEGLISRARASVRLREARRRKAA
jgi:hypothetical protein